MKREVNTKFYTFQQNNSGGDFHINEDIAEIVIIEALNNSDANFKAKKLGMNNSDSCPCCGDRWTWQGDWTDEDEGCEEPMSYDEPIEDYIRNQNSSFDETVIIHYFDGTKKVIKKG